MFSYVRDRHRYRLGLRPQPLAHSPLYTSLLPGSAPHFARWLRACDMDDWSTSEWLCSAGGQRRQPLRSAPGCSEGTRSETPAPDANPHMAPCGTESTQRRQDESVPEPRHHFLHSIGFRWDRSSCISYRTRSRFHGTARTVGIRVALGMTVTGYSVPAVEETCTAETVLGAPANRPLRI